MFRPLPMLRIDLSLIKDDAPKAALLLANFGNFAPEFTEIIPENLPELPGEEFRRAYIEDKSRLDKILSHFEIVPPDTISAPMQPVTLDQLRELGTWLKQIWEQCSDDEERMRQLREDRRHSAQLLHALDQFMDVNIDLTRLQKKSELLDVRVGTLPFANIQRFEEALKLAGYVSIRFFTSTELIHMIIAGAMGQAADVERVLQAAGWRSTDIPVEFHGHPAEVRGELTARMARLEEQYAQQEIDRRTRAAQADFHAQLISAAHTLARAAPYAELATLMRGRGELVSVSGWIPDMKLPRLQELLEQNLPGHFMLHSRPPRDDERLQVPSLLRHHRWLRPFTSLVLNYGVPRYGEIDPTILFAVSFVLMFGMMFGDLGHGIVIALAGMLLRKRLGHYFSLVLAVGFTSAVFGLLYGSVFGYEHLITALWMPPLSDPMLMLGIALGWGVTFILLSTLLTIYNRIVDGRLREALLDSHGVAGLLLYLGLLTGAWRISASGHAGIISPLLVCLSLAAIFFHAWQHNGGVRFVERLLIVVVEGFEAVMAYISNTLSFLRLAAFSLNHVALAIAIFTVGEMMHTAGYWLTVVFGNIFILVLEGAIVAIQALRLEYYEGFSRFFGGDGRPFRPLMLGSGNQLALQD
ncbi:V-type ATP synthase subunit I [Sideroxydans lithotrophicus]|uniref:V-type ATPase 116 kDa subunit n=1 Tax=Sideroxydans lithotrophicus (strain ES-1) TaxID=580332 RepID=D5CN84_SIDLE|nr:V-type ATPase 116kDa subunit family protein [Sideroxydans lithotrophicus]ADE12781.1 V-type ATPase 116 kDa subunit [Sideroxydans lithotrophicus ES-1]